MPPGGMFHASSGNMARGRSGWIGGAALLVLTAVTRPSLAQLETANIGEQGDVAISAERLIGLVYAKSAQEVPGEGNVEERWFGVGQGWTGGGAWSTPYDARRLGVDAFPFDSTSVGFSTAFAYRSSDEAEHWELVVEPRIGYLVMLDDLTGFWARAGVHYHRSNLLDVAEEGWGLGVDALGMLHFTRMLALTLGPSFDQSLDVQRDGHGCEYRSLSLNLGLTGWLSYR